MREMIDANHARATQTGARIVHACGFDSIPSDLGTWADAAGVHPPASAAPPHDGHRVLRRDRAAACRAAPRRAGSRSPRRCAIRRVRRVLRNPYALDPDPEAPHPRSPIDKTPSAGTRASRCSSCRSSWPTTNAPVVRRGHALAGLSVGRGLLVSRGDEHAGQRARRRDGRDDHRRPAGLSAAMKRPRAARRCCRSARRSRARARSPRQRASAATGRCASSPRRRRQARSTSSPTRRRSGLRVDGEDARRVGAVPRVRRARRRRAACMTPSVAMGERARRAAASRRADVRRLRNSRRCTMGRGVPGPGVVPAGRHARVLSPDRGRRARARAGDGPGAVRRQSSELADRSDPDHHDVRPQGSLRREGRAVQGPAHARGAARPRRGADQAARRSRRRPRDDSSPTGAARRQRRRVRRDVRACSATAARSASFPRASRTTSRSSRGSRPAPRGSRSAARSAPAGRSRSCRAASRSSIRSGFAAACSCSTAPPIVDRADAAEHADDVRALTAEIETRRSRRLTINAPDWDTVRALDVVRRLYQPQEISIEDRVELARRFNAYYGAVAADPRVRRR